MKMAQNDDAASLWDALSAARPQSGRFLWGAETSAILSQLVRGSSLGSRRDELRERSVLLAIKDQLAAGLALVELDGIARRLVLCPPDLPAEHISCIAETASIDAVVSDRATPEPWATGVECFVNCGPEIVPAEPRGDRYGQTEWVLLTSGTTGVPKLVVHSLSSLAAPISAGGALGGPVVWSTFYDIRRYGGLQIFLRAVLGGGSMVLSSAEESTGRFLTRAGESGVTHISGTPSHWRRALMSPSARRIAPRYVRMSGEIADQAILDHLRAVYPEANIAHAFASTEAGVAFEVGDGLSGFPASLIGRKNTEVEMKVENGSLRIRSGRIARGYLGSVEKTLADKDGFVDTGDMVELHGDRYYFVGRGDGIINVGGRKVHPEEVEAVINRHPGVEMSLVKARKSPITGAVVVADIVVKYPLDSTGEAVEAEVLQREILKACHDALAPHKVPAAIRFVRSLEVTGSGKLARFHA
jgi:acyl-coenzyme A synthetase/AMP-(fatty) acid ligase